MKCPAFPRLCATSQEVQRGVRAWWRNEHDAGTRFHRKRVRHPPLCRRGCKVIIPMVVSCDPWTNDNGALRVSCGVLRANLAFVTTAVSCSIHGFTEDRYSSEHLGSPRHGPAWLGPIRQRPTPRDATSASVMLLTTRVVELGSSSQAIPCLPPFLYGVVTR